MKNKLLIPIFILLFSLTLLLAGCGGGGTENSSAPGGVNTGVPSVVKLLPVHFIAQTNSFITLKARVLDGNGNAVPNYPVSFTNLSLTGVLNAVTANTDSTGNAEVRISSTTPGFATIVAQVTAGSGVVRDRKTVYFSTNDVLETTMSMAVDSVPGNGIYNETSDFNIFENDSDDTFEVLVTVFDAGGVPVGAGRSVIWGTSHVEAVITRGEAETNVYGQAKAIIQVTPTTIRDAETHVNVFAYADNGAANLTTLFLQPVVVSQTASSLTADPLTVAPGGKSTLTAVVKLNTGAVAPDGTSVSFETTCGTVTPFSQTTGGVASGTFTAPVTEGTCTVSAKVQGVTIGTPVTIQVLQTLAVFPTTLSVPIGFPVSFTITGGNPPYSITSSNPLIATVSPASVGASGGTVTVTGIAVGSATVQVRDASGKTVTVGVTVTSPTSVVVAPTAGSINCTGGGAVTFTVTGGIAPFTASSSNANVTIAGSPVGAVGGSFTANLAAATCGFFPVGTTPVTITVTSPGPPPANTTVTVNVVNP